MSDYTPQIDYSAKDALSPGDPEKTILGADLDAELDAISTAIATKFDAGDIASQAEAQAESLNTVLMTPERVGDWADANAGIVGDLQGLSDPNADRIVFWDDSAGAAALLSVSSNLSLSGTTLDVGSNVAKIASNNTFTGSNTFAKSTLATPAIKLSATSNAIVWYDTDAAASAKGYALYNEGGHLQIITTDDSLAFGHAAIDISRSGVDIASIALVADAITLNGVNVTDFARLSSGNTFTASTHTISSSATPALRLDDTAAGTNQRVWQIENNDGTFGVRTLTDAAGAGETLIAAHRTGTGITDLLLTADVIKFNGVSAADFITDSRTITAGTGLTGGGDLSANRTISLSHLGLQSLSDPGGDRIIMWDDSAGATAWLSASSGAVISGTTLSVNHDTATNFVANEHIDHSSVSITAGTGLTGGGAITSSRTISLSHLGLQSLTDPGADRILFWDDSASATGWLSVGSGLSLSGTALNTSASGVLTQLKTVDGTGSGLDADLLDGSEGSAYAKLATASTFTASNPTLVLSAAIPMLRWNETDATADNKRWIMFADGETFAFATNDDADTTNGNIMVVSRTGTTVDTVDFPNGTLQYGGIEVGFRGLPATSGGSGTFTAAQAGGHYKVTSASSTVTIPANSSVAFPVGTVLTVVNRSGGTCTIAITTDTMYMAGTGSTGSRTLADFGIATALKTASTEWVISGTGLS